MSQTTERRPMKDKREQVVAFFKEWFFGFPQPPLPGTGRGKKNSKKSFITLLYLTLHLDTDTK